MRTALHIPDALPGYNQCDDFLYTNYTAFQEGSVWIYPILKAYGYKLMHYSGDTDGGVPLLGTRRWISSLDWTVTHPWRAWTTDKQVSGYVQDYENFRFATVHGVGHMAP